jgi:hypothetical protein
MPLDPDARWHVNGPETDAQAEGRAASIFAWLSGLQTTLGDDEIVLLVSHGQILAKTLRHVFALHPDEGGDTPPNYGFDGLFNTAVTVVNMPNPSGTPQSFFSRGPPVKANLEIHNNTTHLGEERILDWLDIRKITRYDPMKETARREKAVEMWRLPESRL